MTHKEFCSKEITGWLLFGHTAKGDHINGSLEDLKIRLDKDCRLTFASTIIVGIKTLSEHIISNIPYNDLHCWYKSNKEKISYKIQMPQNSESLKIDREGNEYESNELVIVFAKDGKRYKLVDVYPF